MNNFRFLCGHDIVGFHEYEDCRLDTDDVSSSESKERVALDKQSFLCFPEL